MITKDILRKIHKNDTLVITLTNNRIITGQFIDVGNTRGKISIPYILVDTLEGNMPYDLIPKRQLYTLDSIKSIRVQNKNYDRGMCL